MFAEEKPKKGFSPLWLLLLMILILIAMLTMSLSVQAAGSVDEDDPAEETDYTLGDRVNLLELRLEELGYQINDMQTAIESLETADQEQEETRLAISDKLDLVIIALDSLIENDLAQMQKQEDADLLAAEYRETITGALSVNEAAFEELNENTVSGNTLISDFNSSMEENLQLVSESTLQELNKTLLATNTFLSYLFILVLIVLVLLIVYGLGALLNRSIFRHIK